MIFFWFLARFVTVDQENTSNLTSSLSCVCCSFIHKTNTVEFKSATFPNAGSRHLLDDSVLESHTPTRGQAESSTLSSGISLGITHTHKATGSQTGSFFFYQYMSWSYDFRKQWRVGAQWGDVLACIWEVSLLKHSHLQTQSRTVSCAHTWPHAWVHMDTACHHGTCWNLT